MEASYLHHEFGYFHDQSSSASRVTAGAAIIAGSEFWSLGDTAPLRVAMPTREGRVLMLVRAAAGAEIPSVLAEMMELWR